MRDYKEHFEANMLDGDKVEDCGGAMLSASSVWEYFSERLEEAERGGASTMKEELRREIQRIVDEADPSTNRPTNPAYWGNTLRNRLVALFNQPLAERH